VVEDFDSSARVLQKSSSGGVIQKQSCKHKTGTPLLRSDYCRHIICGFNDIIFQNHAPWGWGDGGSVSSEGRLDRTVAIKILPADISADPVSKQRFEREAKTISGLNHPNICVLYDIGHQDGVDYIVMECLEGETLAKRLEKGPLSLEQALKYGA